MVANHEEDDAYLLVADQHDFDTQLTYFFNEPVPAQGGGVLSFECTGDNSADNPDRMFGAPHPIG